VKAAAKAASRASRRERREGSAGGPGHHNAVVEEEEEDAPDGGTLFDELLVHLDLSQTAVMGQSFGAATAYQATIDHPGLFNAGVGWDQWAWPVVDIGNGGGGVVGDGGGGVVGDGPEVPPLGPIPSLQVQSEKWHNWGEQRRLLDRIVGSDNGSATADAADQHAPQQQRQRQPQEQRQHPLSRRAYMPGTAHMDFRCAPSDHYISMFALIYLTTAHT
jgi:pimeloyl-ACP methyl ester carboxylesterase